MTRVAPDLPPPAGRRSARPAVGRGPGGSVTEVPGWFGPPRNGRRMMTWWGAYRATRKQLPPMKQVLKWLRASRAKMTLGS